MKSNKKSVVGLAVLPTLLNGEIEIINSVSSVKIAGYYLPAMLLRNDSRTALFGLKNGF